MPESVEAVVVGAGVVGLAITRELALAGFGVLLVDGETQFGSWTSSRNSEVIHAGIYYPPLSNKARLCVEGRRLLYDYCGCHAVPYRQLGKLIFARNTAQIATLEAIKATGETAGVDDLRLLSATEVRTLEGELDCAAALYSPSTGIVDSHALMLALLGEAEANGAMFSPRARIASVRAAGGNWLLYMTGEREPVVSTRILVNSAGLGAQCLAANIEGLAPHHIPPLHLARGSYFTYAGSLPFAHLIYPVPEPGGLGLHLTLDMGGQARFGPDVEWIEAVDYRVDPGRKPAFVAAARAIWPQLNAEQLHPGYAGIRPKISPPGQPAGDFVISLPSHHGCEGLVNLFGIESPGLTASLAIAKQVLGGLL